MFTLTLQYGKLRFKLTFPVSLIVAILITLL